MTVRRFGHRGLAATRDSHPLARRVLAAPTRNRVAIVTAEPAISDRLVDRAETRNIIHFQGPCQRGDGPYSLNGVGDDPLGRKGPARN